MSNLKHLRLLGAATLLSVSALAAVAQTQEPAPPTERPPMAKPETAPQTAPTPPTQQRPSTPPKSSAAPAVHPLMGLTAFAADGTKVGDVRAVKTGPDGKTTAIHLRSGGFLGFGGKIVEVPESKFTQKGDNIQLGLTAEEVSKLPEVKNAS